MFQFLGQTCFKLLVISLIFANISCKKFKDEEKPVWAKKDIRDYSEADLERLLDQWEEDEEPLPEDELPEYLRKPAQIDMSKLDFSDPETVLKMTKKGKTLMVFVTVIGKPTKAELESVTSLWQTSLNNNHIQVERYLIDDHRAIFMFKDGSQAWDAKNFLVEQEECDEVVIENKTYYGKNSEKNETSKNKEEL
ncbi:mesoderm development candidate 2 [Chamberlinius hualienensis]